MKTNDSPLKKWLLLSMTLAMMANPLSAYATAGSVDPKESDKSLLAQADGDKSTRLQVRKPLIPVTRDFKLDNGLRVVVSEDHSVPVGAVVIIYDVGARDEEKGKSGFAHLFEHMMFEGSKNVAKGEYFKYIQAEGGLVNASTHADYTDYFERLPSHKIELAFWLESDRMRSLAVTPENFKNQLETVKEEKRLRIDNQPYMPAALAAEELIFDNWANGHPVIGYFEDLEHSSVEDVKRFFDKYYCPNNAVMAVVGDVDSQKIEEMVRKYFGTIPRQKDPGRPDLSEPVQTKPKSLAKEDNQANMPAFWLAWKAPQRRDPDSFILNIIQVILSTGQSSRLYQRLVKEDQVALQVSNSYEERRGPSEYDVFVVYKPDNQAKKVQGIVLEELEKIKNEDVSDQELEKAKNQVLRILWRIHLLARSTGESSDACPICQFLRRPYIARSGCRSVLEGHQRRHKKSSEKGLHERWDYSR
ncbi:MAG: insulinase family protein [Cyanobacteria bacterium]|nr:insulinase family protein [Cyanobacteriota bacterium]